MKKRKMFKSFNGFTLAETLIVLAILGVVAALTVPTLVKRQSEAANRTKIKKAMRTYDAAIQQMTKVNDITALTELTTFGGSKCKNTITYFKTVSFLGEDEENKCKFRAADGLYWDITDITKPIVSLDEENLTSEAAGTKGNNKAFQFVTSFDSKARAFRTNDAEYEKSLTNGAFSDMQKLFAFVKPELGGAGGGNEPTKKTFCTVGDDNKCTVGSLTFEKKTIEEDEAETYTANLIGGCWDSENETYISSPCGVSEITPGDIYFSGPVDPSTYCPGCTPYQSDYQAAAKEYCASQGGAHLATMAELKAAGKTSGLWLASEEYHYNGAYYLYNGGVNLDTKDAGYTQMLCVGN